MTKKKKNKKHKSESIMDQRIKEDMRNTILSLDGDYLKQVQDELLEEVDHRLFLRSKPVLIELANRDVVRFAHLMDPEYMSKDTHYKEQLLYLYQAATEKRFVEFLDNGKLDKEFLKGKLHLVLGAERRCISTLDPSMLEEIDIGYLIVNLPPRHGKSYLLRIFITWVLGVDKTHRILYAMYSSTVASDFSKSIRDQIKRPDEEDMIGAEMERQILYHDVFKDLDIERGEDTQAKWSVVGGRQTFTATSPGGEGTGFGATIKIVDDLIKNSAEAFSELSLKRDSDWFYNTFISRGEKGKYGTLNIIISTRWSRGDITGVILEGQKEAKPGEETPMLHLSIPALLDREKGIMLAPETLSYKEYRQRTLNMNPAIVEANFNQKIIQSGSKLYNHLKLYDKKEFFNAGVPLEYVGYIDIADTGKDYTAVLIAAIDTYNQKAYVVDVLYNQKGRVFNEPVIAQMLFNYGVSRAYIEGNGMGHVIGGNINDIMEEEYNIINNVVISFHQKYNKESRIYNHAKYVENNVLLPNDYKDSKDTTGLIKEVLRYSIEGKNEFDDGTDAITGLAETMIKMMGGVNFNEATFKNYEDPDKIKNGEIMFEAGKITEDDIY